MSDEHEADTLLYNCIKGTQYLMEARHDWEVMARDESLPEHVRLNAGLFARALREELAP